MKAARSTNTPRNMPAALEAVRAAAQAVTEHVVSLRSVIAQARLRNAPALAGFSEAEMLELVELALAPGATLPAGAAGEAALAYLVALRAHKSPIPLVIAALQRFGSNDNETLDVVAGWMRDEGERQLAQANALQAEADRRFGTSERAYQ